MKKPPKTLAVCAPPARRLPMLDSTRRTAISRDRSCGSGPVCRELGRQVPGVDGSLSMQPGAQAVPPVRNTSASSMQSPPVRAEATSVITLLPVLARPGASPRSRCSWGRSRCRARPADGRQRAELLLAGVRSRKSMSPKVQARVEALLEGPAKVEPASIPGVDCRALWDRMDAHGFSQNETARLAGISSAHFSNIMNGKATRRGVFWRSCTGCCSSRRRRSWSSPPW